MKKYMLFLLVCIVFFSTGLSPVEAKQAPSQIVYHDISTSYAKEAILRLTKRNIVSGNGAGAFLPRDKVTRAEIATMMSRLLQMNPVDNDISAFRDVPKQAWYYGWVHAGTNLGIINGRSERTFKPLDPVTRQEAAVMMVRAMKVDASTGEEIVYRRYEDAAELAAWSRAEVGVATLHGWLQGSGGKFRPNDPITREEVAVLMDRILHDGNVIDVLDRVNDSAFANNASEIQMGWLYNGTTKQYISYAKTSGINTIVPRWYYIESTGNVSDETDLELVNWAHNNGRKVWAMLGNRSNAETTHKMLSDSTARRTVITKLAANAKKYKLDGINVDFENVIPEDRSYLTTFIQDLSTELHKQGAVISIDVSPDLGSDWTAAFDYKALGRYADYVVLMGYDEHWGGSPIAGSVSSLPWLTAAVDKLLTQVPASKSVIALPLYTREWRLNPVVTSEDISLTQQGQRIRSSSTSLVWNHWLGQYEAGYVKGGTDRKIWTEDARSLSMKHNMLADRNPAGYAYWYVGSETPDVWQATMNMERYKSYMFDI